MNLHRHIAPKHNQDHVLLMDYLKARWRDAEFQLSDEPDFYHEWDPNYQRGPSPGNKWSLKTPYMVRLVEKARIWRMLGRPAVDEAGNILS